MTLTQEDLNAIEGLFTGRFEGIDKQFESIDKQLDSMEQKIEGIDIRLEHVENDIKSLKIGQLNLRKELKTVSYKVDATYEHDLDNWTLIQESKDRIAILEC